MKLLNTVAPLFALTFLNTVLHNVGLFLTKHFMPRLTPGLFSRVQLEYQLMSTTELRSFPPVSDSIDFVKQIDWQDVRNRLRKGVNITGVAIAVLGEKLHDFGTFLGNV